MQIRAQMSGAVGLLGGLLLVVGAGARFVPTSSVTGPVVRALDSLGPWWLALAFLCFLGLAFLGSRRLGGIMALITFVALGQLYGEHRRLSLPSAAGEGEGVRIVFFNAFRDNEVPAAEVVAGLMARNADILVIAEREALGGAEGQLAERYGFLSPCAAPSCSLLVALKEPPVRFWELQLNEAFGPRYGVAEIEYGDGKRFFLSSAHLGKPWLSGFASAELERLIAQYNWFEGPVVAVGDFNAAPWSYPMRRILNETHFRALHLPPGTWPKVAGGFGVPIDQVLVRGGPRVAKIESFDAELGSNHLGLVMEVVLP